MIPERLRPDLDVALPLGERFAAEGEALYLVGGTVRDAIAGRPGRALRAAAGVAQPGVSSAGAAAGDEAAVEESDIDFTTTARPDDIERIVRPVAAAVWTQGKRFGTIGATVGGRRLEITTHRAEAYSYESRKPDVVFGDDIVSDLSRRDFTINAMALSLPDLELIDPYAGLDDLAAARLRTPLEPRDSFSDDPLRMLRAARFLAGYELEPDAALVDAVKELRDRLGIVSAERIRDELDKLLVLPRPSKGLWFLVGTGLAGIFIPELPALALEQDPVHRHKDVLAHTVAVVEKTRPDKILRLAALFHDVGKPRTKAIGPAGVSFHHHDVVGARMTRDRLKALRYPGDEIEAVTGLVKLHLRFHTYKMGWTDSAVRRYAREAGPLLDRLNELTRSDCTTRNAARAKALNDRMDELESRLADLKEREELDSIRPEIDGDAVMAELGIRPGRAVGEALAFLLQIRLDEGFVGEEEIRRRLRGWWAGKSIA